jgi:hypothetical protein
MAINFLLKRSTTASKRPTAAQLDIGELSLNYDADTAGVFFEDSAGNVRKVGPTEVSATAPNASPAGSSGNSLGELWYDTGTSNLKIWTGASFVDATAIAGAGGSDTQVQFNSTGTLAGSANFTFDGTTVSAAGLSILGTSRFGVAATQDAIEILGRAGGTSSFRVALRPATLSANRTQDLQNLGGTVALNVNKLSFFAATTSAELAGVISDETGTGALVFATSPTLVTPVLGVATGTSFNGITGLSSTNPAALGAVAVGTGTTAARADHVHPTTGLGLTSGTLAQFAATTSSQLAGVISDETGSGALVFATSPTLTTPTLGVASATSINKVAITAPATSATLTIANGKTLTASNTLTFTGTDASSVAFGTGGTVAYTANKLSVFAATTSAELAGVISDETGSGALVFATSPTLVTPALGTPASGNLSNCTNVPAGQLSGTIPSAVLGNSSLFIGTTSVALNRGTGILALTGMGTITPNADNVSDLGSASLRWANVYTGDLHLKNDRGDYTIIEEEDALTLRNNKTGKVYNFVLEERK